MASGRNSYRHICMSKIPLFSALWWYTKEMYVLHYKYYNTYTFLQANSKPQKIKIVVSFLKKISKLNSIQHLFNSCNSKI